MESCWAYLLVKGVLKGVWWPVGGLGAFRGVSVCRCDDPFDGLGLYAPTQSDLTLIIDIGFSLCFFRARHAFAS